MCDHIYTRHAHTHLLVYTCSYIIDVEVAYNILFEEVLDAKIRKKFIICSRRLTIGKKKLHGCYKE